MLKVNSHALGQRLLQMRPQLVRGWVFGRLVIIWDSATHEEIADRKAGAR